MLLATHGIAAPMLALAARYPVGQRGMSVKELLDLLKMSGLRTVVRRFTGSADEFGHLPFPFIAHLKREHFVVVTGVSGGDVHFLDPGSAAGTLSKTDFIYAWSGVFVAGDPDTHTRPLQRKSALFGLLKEIMRGNGQLWLLLMSVVLIVTLITVSTPWLLTRAALLASDAESQGEKPLALALLMLSLTLVFGLWLRARIALFIQLRLDRLLTERFMSRLLALPMRVFSVLPAGDMLARVNAMSSVRDFLSGRLVTLALDTTIVLVSLTILMIQRPDIGALFIGMVALASMALAASWPAYFRLVQAETLQYSGYHSVLTETVGAGVDIKVTGRESAFLARLIGAFSRHQAALEARAARSATFDAIYGFQERVAPVLAVIGALLVFSPSGQEGLLSALYSYFLLAICSPSVRMIQSFFMQSAMVRLNADRMESIHALLEHEPEDGQESRHSGSTCGLKIKVENVGFSYLGTGKPVLEHIHACFDDSRLNVVLGPSGGGKSTLLRIMGGLLVPDTGRVRIEVADAVAPGPLVAYLNQHPKIFAGTVTENISMFEPLGDPERIRACAAAACVDEDIRSMPLGYETLMVAGGQTVSAGQAQRIALARLLYSRAPIMLLDEFTSDIDARAEAEIVRNLRSWPGLKVIATHRTGWLTPEDSVVNLCTMRTSPEPEHA